MICSEKPVEIQSRIILLLNAQKKKKIYFFKRVTLSTKIVRVEGLADGSGGDAITSAYPAEDVRASLEHDCRVRMSSCRSIAEDVQLPPSPRPCTVLIFRISHALRKI